MCLPFLLEKIFKDHHHYICTVKHINRFVDILLYTSIFAACCATGLCMATERLMNGVSPPLISPLHVLVFGSTLLVYNTPRIVRRPAGRSKDLNIKSGIIFFSLRDCCLPVPVYTGNLYPYSLPAAHLAYSHSPIFCPCCPLKTKSACAISAGSEMIVLTGVWTTATSVLPMLYWHKNLAGFPFEILLRFVFVFALCVA